MTLRNAERVTSRGDADGRVHAVAPTVVDPQLSPQQPGSVKSASPETTGQQAARPAGIKTRTKARIATSQGRRIGESLDVRSPCRLMYSHQAGALAAAAATRMISSSDRSEASDRTTPPSCQKTARPRRAR